MTISYTTNRKTGTLAVLMNYIDGDMECDYGVVSVNLCSGLQDGQMAHVYTNNIPQIDRWLLENGIAEDTPDYGEGFPAGEPTGGQDRGDSGAREAGFI